MFTFDKKDFQRFAVSTVGALAVSTACITAAVAPVHAAAVANAPLTVGDWQAQVERQIDDRLSLPDRFNALSGDEGERAVVAVRFNADGEFAGAALSQSSGQWVYDHHAVNLARAIRYPALPAGLRGTPQTVEMQLYYNVTPADYAAQHHQPAQLASASQGHNVAVAFK